MQKSELRFSKLTINQEYLELVPRLSEQDRKRLSDSIKKDGLMVPITANEEGVILDGHTRYEICKELKIKVRYSVKKFDNKDDEMRFVVMTNLARRQLSKFQKVELAWLLYELEQKRAEERVNWKKNKDLCVTDAEGKIVKAKKKIKEGNAALLFGKKIGVGKTFIGQIDYLKKYATPEIMENVRIGKMSVVMAHDLVRGLKMMSTGEKPLGPVKFCPTCNTETQSPKMKHCHVHKWFCCQKCGWGV